MGNFSNCYFFTSSKRLMTGDETKEVCKIRSNFPSIVYAYPYKTQTWVVCMHVAKCSLVLLYGNGSN